MNLSKNIAISFLIILNILLILKLNKFQTTKNTYIKNNIDLKHQLELHKNYIIENNREINITFDDIFKQLPINSKFPKEEINWVVIIPQNVCMSCVTSLFSDLANLKIPKENLYLIQEQTIKSIEREWHSYSYENSLVDSQNIFNKNNFNTKIIIAKMIINKKQVNFFHYEAELSEFLDHFIQEYS